MIVGGLLTVFTVMLALNTNVLLVNLSIIVLILALGGFAGLVLPRILEKL